MSCVARCGRQLQNHTRLNRDIRKPRKLGSAEHTCPVNMDGSGPRGGALGNCVRCHSLQLPIATRAFPNVTLGSSHPLRRAFFPEVSEIPTLSQPGAGRRPPAPGTGHLPAEGPPEVPRPRPLPLLQRHHPQAESAGTAPREPCRLTRRCRQLVPSSDRTAQPRTRGLQSAGPCAPLTTYLVLPENHHAQGAENRDF